MKKLLVILLLFFVVSCDDDSSSEKQYSEKQSSKLIVNCITSGQKETYIYSSESKDPATKQIKILIDGNELYLLQFGRDIFDKKLNLKTYDKNRFQIDHIENKGEIKLQITGLLDRQTGTLTFNHLFTNETQRTTKLYTGFGKCEKFDSEIENKF